MKGRTLNPLSLLIKAYDAAVLAAHPSNHLNAYFPPLPKGRLIIVGAGKAAASMAQAAEAHYGPKNLEGLVITRYGHAAPTKKIRVLEAAHPVPNEEGVMATKKLLEHLSGLSEDDLVLCLISGGGSALLIAPRGLSLKTKAELTKALLHSGATIGEMNIVRKHLSQVKGGQLAAKAQPARVMSLILSDVVGDELSSIASGPTVPDPSTFADALEVIERYKIAMPDVKAILQKGLKGEVPETPKAEDALFDNVSNHLVASNQQSLEAVADFFRSQGINAHILSSTVEGEARDVAKVHAAIAKQVKRYAQPFSPPCALISGGETTVSVKQKGKGGRNGEFALSLAIELAGTSGIYALAADTDGIDGSETNAGAFVTPQSFDKVALYEARQFLEKNDSYSFFEKADGLFITGPTQTNVNDLRIILILE